MTKIKANNGVTYTLPDNPVWHKGPPPETGWWPASYRQTIIVLRWYDQKTRTWGAPTNPFQDKSDAAFYAGYSVSCGDDIEWTDRWWLKGGK